MTGVKNLLEVEEVIVKILKGIEKSKEDGKWDVGDLVNFLDVALVIKPALEGIGEIPTEIMDIDEAELEVIVSKAMEGFPGLPPKAVAIAKGAFKMLKGGVEIYQALKG